jgi:hypothetical protein
MLRLIACLVGAATLTGCAADAARPDPERDKSTIEAALRFAHDVVLAYPGGGDRDSGEFCTRMQTLYKAGLGVFRHQPDDTWKVHVSHAFTK